MHNLTYVKTRVQSKADKLRCQGFFSGCKNEEAGEVQEAECQRIKAEFMSCHPAYPLSS